MMHEPGADGSVGSAASDASRAAESAEGDSKDEASTGVVLMCVSIVVLPQVCLIWKTIPATSSIPVNAE